MFKYWPYTPPLFYISNLNQTKMKVGWHNKYYGNANNQKNVRSSCPCHFKSTSPKAQIQLRAGVFNFPKRTSQKKNNELDDHPHTEKPDKHHKLHEKDSAKNKKTNEAKRQFHQREKTKHETPNKTKTETTFDSFSDNSPVKAPSHPIEKVQDTATSNEDYSDSNQKNSSSLSLSDHVSETIDRHLNESDENIEHHESSDLKISDIESSLHKEEGIADKETELHKNVDQNNENKLNDEHESIEENAQHLISDNVNVHSENELHPDEVELSSDQHSDDLDSDEDKNSRFQRLLANNQKLVLAFLKNQEEILTFIDNDYTRQAMEHLREAASLIDASSKKKI